MSSTRLQTWFPWVSWPVICNGPMIGSASPALATEVSKAGGIGFLSSVVHLQEDSADLGKLDADLAASRELLGGAGGKQLPVGISFITGHDTIGLFAQTALPVVARHSPAAVWLFAPGPGAGPHAGMIRALKALSPPPRVFVQVGNVVAAREAVRDGADVLVCQGIDAGGHQLIRGTGVVSLVPEVRNMLRGELAGCDVGLLAAGGIADDRGVAAMMALEADGVVMGTRFTVAYESVYPDFRKQLVLDTVDGGTWTLKSPFNDQIAGNSLWRPLYDGRSIMGPIHEKFLSGSSLDECQKSLKEDYPPEESAKMIGTWAGTGVGLVTRPQPAREIVMETREGAKEHIRKLAALL